MAFIKQEVCFTLVCFLKPQGSFKVAAGSRRRRSLGHHRMECCSLCHSGYSQQLLPGCLLVLHSRSERVHYSDNCLVPLQCLSLKFQFLVHGRHQIPLVADCLYHYPRAGTIGNTNSIDFSLKAMFFCQCS